MKYIKAWIMDRKNKAFLKILVFAFILAKFLPPNFGGDSKWEEMVAKTFIFYLILGLGALLGKDMFLDEDETETL